MKRVAEPLQRLVVPISRLALDPKNARRHDERNVEAIATSLKRFGQVKPIVVQRDGMIVRAGNGTVVAAKSLGWKRLAATVLDMPNEEAIAYAISDNRTAELADWDPEVLASLMEAWDEDARLALGFSEEELAELTAPPPVPPGEIVEDEVPELPEEPTSKQGQLWTLGRHRVLCGDSTVAADVESVLGGAKPFLMVTDPPYGVDYDGGEVNTTKRERLVGDTSASLYHPAFELTPCTVVYTWFAGSQALPVYTAAIRHGFEPRALIIWNKLKAHYAAPSAHYKQRHEPCLYSVRKGRSAKWGGDMTVPSVWDIDQAHRNEHHPTQKPVECMARPIRNHGGPKDHVYDPFLGSGTTLIAAEQLDRTCYGIEIDPRYVDVIIQRWENLTGDKAVLA